MSNLSKFFLFIVFFSFTFFYQALAQQVPSIVEFSGMTLKLDRKTQQDIQNRVNLLLENEGFNRQVRTADLYLPLIGETLQKYNLPEDFKYLAILDNKLTDSLQFWAMPLKTALEYNLNVNNQVDERENIVLATENIAEALQNNNLGLKNWVFTLLTYHLKLEGVNDYIQKSLSNLNELLNRKEMNLNAGIHQDILQILAYKIAFDNAERVGPQRKFVLVSYEKAAGKTLKELADDFTLPYSAIKRYNRWLKTDDIPANKNYPLIIPMPTEPPRGDEDIYQIGIKNDQSLIGPMNIQEEEQLFYHTVAKGESIYAIARMYQIPPQTLMQWNNLTLQSILKIGQKLLINAPNNVNIPQKTEIKGQVQVNSKIHTVIKGEGLYSIARRYAVSVNDLRTWNTLQSDILKIGQKLTILLKKNANEGVESPVEEKKPNTETTSPDNSKPRTIAPKTVPTNLTLGNLNLKITAAGQALIQKDVNSLLRSPTHFFIKLHRVNLYSPLVEEVLADQSIPLDFRYLPIQESAYMGNAVSTSNAVGYWQFKDGSAREVGITINNDIDERKHVINSTLGAAKYLKRHNLFFDNWLFSLLSYNLGFTGMKNYLESMYPKNAWKNLKEIEINEKTHWYILKFLAHKVAFSDEIGVETPDKELTKFTQANAKTLLQIARESGATLQEVQPHNYWLKRSQVPMDKTYTVIVPKAVKK